MFDSWYSTLNVDITTMSSAHTRTLALESYAAEGNSIKRTRYLSEFEVAFVEECMRKHGRDFKVCLPRHLVALSGLSLNSHSLLQGHGTQHQVERAPAYA